MLPEAALRDVLSRSDLDRTGKLLACLAVDAGTAKTVGRIKELARSQGLRAAQTWNVSTYLARSTGKASRVADGWILTTAGRTYIRSLNLAPATALTAAASGLRTHSTSIQNAETRRFVEEAIGCLESQHYRAAVVLTWVGAVSLLYDHVVNNALAPFNAEATRRNPKHRPATTTDDLARLKESDFLDYLEGCSIIGKSIRKELGVCLDLRNGCGHPNSLKFAEARVAAHVEALVLNVFVRF